ncbi:MAG: hypothetical protein ACRD13_01135 [Terriglobales bacterium]
MRKAGIAVVAAAAATVLMAGTAALGAKPAPGDRCGRLKPAATQAKAYSTRDTAEAASIRHYIECNPVAALLRKA